MDVCQVESILHWQACWTHTVSELQAPSTVDMISRLLVLATLALVTTAEGAAKHPHIVHIVADDLGYK